MSGEIRRRDGKWKSSRKEISMRERNILTHLAIAKTITQGGSG